MSSDIIHLTSAISRQVLANDEIYVLKQVESTLFVEQKNWQAVIETSLEGLEALNAVQSDLEEAQLRCKGELLNNLTVAAYRINSLAQAINYGSQACELAKELYESSNPKFICYIENLGDAYKASDRNDEAIECYLQVVHGLEKEDENSKHLATVLYNISLLCYNSNDESEKSVPFLAQAEPLFRDVWDKDPTEENLKNYSSCLFLFGLVNLSPSVQQYEPALDALHLVKQFGEEFPDWKIQEPQTLDLLIQKGIRLLIKQETETVS